MPCLEDGCDGAELGADLGSILVILFLKALRGSIGQHAPSDEPRGEKSAAQSAGATPEAINRVIHANRQNKRFTVGYRAGFEIAKVTTELSLSLKIRAAMLMNRTSGFVELTTTLEMP